MDTLGVDLVVDDKGANAKLTNFTGKLKLTEKELNDLGKNSSFAGKFSDQLDKAEKRHTEFLRRYKQRNSSAVLGGQGNDFTDALRNSVGIPLATGIGTAAGAALGAGVVIGLKSSLDASVAADRGQRLLNATVKETGIAYKTLADQADAFAKDTVQSTGQAREVFAQIVNFANAAGRSDKIEEFRKKFADLAAAKGINASQLGDISRQLNALTDEATDKLLNANPSAFYDKFAASIGKTADQLTDAEKRAAVFDEVLRKGAIFNGEAANNVHSTAGEVAQLSANIENIKTKIGDGIAIPLNFIVNAVNNATGGGDQNSPFWIGLANAVFNGSAPGFGSENSSPGQFGAVNTADEQRWKQIQKNFLDNFNKTKEDIKSAIAEPNKDLQNYALRYFTPTLSNNPVEADKQRQAGVAAAKTFLEGQKKAFEEIFKSGNLGLIRDNIKIFDAQKGLFDKKDADALTASLSSGLAAAYKKGLEQAGTAVIPLRAKLKELVSDKNLLAGDKNALISDFNRAIKQSVDAINSKVKEFEKTYGSLFDSIRSQSHANNPFSVLFDEADARRKAFQEGTRGLSTDLISQFEAIENKANSLKVFDTRLDTALKASDLREDASNFRNYGSVPKTGLSEENLAKLKLEFIRSTGIRAELNTNAVLGIQSGSRAEFVLLQRFNDEQNGIYRGDRDAGVFKAIAEDQEHSFAGRLQRQIDIANRLAKTPEERAAAERRIIGLTSGVDISQLDERLRNAAASARENEAARLENAEKDAARDKVEEKQLRTQLAADIKKLRKLAEKEGVDAIIRIIDETNGKIESRLAKRATQKDTEKFYTGI
jgi:hypothetical protein